VAGVTQADIYNNTVFDLGENVQAQIYILYIRLTFGRILYIVRRAVSNSVQYQILYRRADIYNKIGLMFGHFESECGIQQNACRKRVYAIARREKLYLDATINLVYRRTVSNTVQAQIYILIII
jgi:hypothetical protein